MAGVLSVVYLASSMLAHTNDTQGNNIQVVSESEPSSNPGLGRTQETVDGIAITASAVSYDVESPSSSLIGEPLGSFATVTFSISNNSIEPHRMFVRQITGTIAGSEYGVTGLTDTGGNYLGILQSINPGLTLEVVAYFDIPAGQTLDTFSYESSQLGGSQVTFDLP